MKLATQQSCTVAGLTPSNSIMMPKEVLFIRLRSPFSYFMALCAVGPTRRDSPQARVYIHTHDITSSCSVCGSTVGYFCFSLLCSLGYLCSCIDAAYIKPFDMSHPLETEDHEWLKNASTAGDGECNSKASDSQPTG